MAKRFSRSLVALMVLISGCRTPWQPFSGSASRDDGERTVRRVPENLPPLDPGASPPVGQTPQQTGPQFPAATPKLDLTVKAPVTVQQGSPVLFAVTVQNNGQELARDVVVETRFNNAFRFRDGPELVNHTKLRPLPAGASRTVEVPLTAVALGEGRVAFALKSGGREVVWKATYVTIVPKRYDLRVDVPPLRTVANRMEFTIRLLNVSSTDMQNVTVGVTLDAKVLRPIEGSAGIKIADGRLVWNIPRLKAEQGVQLQAECECLAISPAACVVVEVASSNAPSESRLACVQIIPTGKPFDLRIADKDDLLRVGSETEVTISVQNRSGKRGTLPTLRVDVPAEFRVTSTSVWEADRELTVKTTTDKGLATFAPVPLVVAGGVLTYRLKVRALRPGSVAFRAALIQDGIPTLQLSEPITVNAK